MAKGFKILFSFFLFCSTVSILPLFAEKFLSGGIEYGIGHIEVDWAESKWDMPNGTALITQLSEGWLAKTPKKLIIPPTVEYHGKSYRVTRIASCATVGLARMLFGDEIEEIVLPETMETLEFHSLYGCRRLKKITIPASLTEIDENALPLSNIGGQSQFYTYNLEEIVVDKNNPKYQTVDGVLFDKDFRTLLIYPPLKRDKLYTIPTGVNTLSKYSFNGTKFLERLKIPESVTSIEQSAFNATSIKYINIPASVTNLRKYDFSKNMEIQVVAGSYGETYVKENGFTYTVK
ncbi:MAG: leucine-rich repeat domain-containing protein [Treponema sp.]|nr:leucine-rich repeat domain-containing protein [Treponema sp.]